MNFRNIRDLQRKCFGILTKIIVKLKKCVPHSEVCNDYEMQGLPDVDVYPGGVNTSTPFVYPVTLVLKHRPGF